MLSTDTKQRKQTPIITGCLDYFPLALAAVARVSFKGNEKHNPGQPMHWSREKSTDHADCIGRHMADRNETDPDSGELHAAHIAWRALAMLELAEEARLKGGETKVEAPATTGDIKDFVVKYRSTTCPSEERWYRHQDDVWYIQSPGAFPEKDMSLAEFKHQIVTGELVEIP